MNAANATTIATPAGALYGPDHVQLQDSLKKFIDAEVNPHVDEWEKAEIFPAHELFRKMGKLGFLGVNKPVANGGMGLDYSYAAAFAEALSLRRHPDGHRRADRHGHACTGQAWLG